ncbi:unnamed protein product [Rotaria sp. Silwood2]|nr:unnamed protein product [Rotaria sp. Silwood2]
MMIVNHTRANYNNDNQEPVAVNPSTVRSLNRLNRCSTSTPLARSNECKLDVLSTAFNINMTHDQRFDGAAVKQIPQCLKEIFRLTEMQSDDYNLDRVLFYACHDDQENLCSQVSSGNGQNYLYLYEKKLNIMMPSAVIY